jgi:transcription elongation factor GreB
MARQTLMGRVRPDKPKPMQPSYVTPEGKRRMLDELDQLWRVKRPEVTRAVSDAAALGDRSENAEYIYGKKMLREIDRRVRFLRRRLEVLTVVERTPDDTSRVFFGAWVQVEAQGGRRRTLRIVGPDETAHAKRYVSVHAPLAQALLKKAVGDEVMVATPRGTLRYLILTIAYGARPSRDEEE